MLARSCSSLLWQGYRMWNFRMHGVSTSRPCERRDPYAAASRLGSVANASRTNTRRWLWVPAFAGTTR
jgi:hypothetical protein